MPNGKAPYQVGDKVRVNPEHYDILARGAPVVKAHPLKMGETYTVTEITNNGLKDLVAVREDETQTNWGWDWFIPALDLVWDQDAKLRFALDAFGFKTEEDLMAFLERPVQ